MNDISKEMKITMLESMIKIRRFEEAMIQLYKEAKIAGHLHPCIGEEGVAVGACSAIGKKDYIVSTHRGHGHCIAKGVDLKKMVAELFGKATGCCKGRGGSMHIADPSVGVLGANGIVGGGMPIAVGAGLGCKMDGKNIVSVCFFGDGAVNNGVFHESLNMAAIFKLPVIFICENNMYAISTKERDSTSGENIAKKGQAYGIPGYIVDGSDVLEVFSIVKDAVKNARNSKGPSLIEAKTYRFYGHHLNDEEKYREKAEVQYHRKAKDPIINLKNKLLAEKIINEDLINVIEKKVLNSIAEAIDYAVHSPEPEGFE